MSFNFRHYSAFLGCIKYQALINNEECPAARLDDMIQQLNMRPDVVMWCDYFDSIDKEFAINKSEICYSSSIIRGMVEYGCLKFDVDILPNPVDRCRMELNIYGCVQAVLSSSGVMCGMGDIRTVMGQDEVRLGLLDGVPSNCDTRLSDSTCTQDFYIYAEGQASDCITALFSMASLPMFTDVDTVPSSDPSKKNLKCRYAYGFL